jgi:streptogramin lyase
MERVMKLYRILLMSIAAAIAACSGGNSGTSTDSSPAPMLSSLQGTVHGGQAPISGSAVTLYAASQQPLSPAATVATATTDSNGNFTFTSFTCPAPGALMYISSLGGNPGGGVNSAIHLMAVLGQCQNLTRSVTVNELTTVAAAYTANQFIGPSGCVDCSGGLPAAMDNISGPAPGLPNAIANAALLVDVSSGAPAAALPTTAECPTSGPAPANCTNVRKVNTLGNALAACVNSAGPTSSQCVQLFQCATVGAAWASSTTCSVPAGAAQPTDTLQAILNVARNPGKISPTGLDYTSIRNAVFSPGITAHPTDETLSLNFTGPEFGQLQDLAIDAGGNVWVTNYDDGGNAGDAGTVVKLAPNGTLLGKFTVNSAANTAVYDVAIDGSGNAWLSDFSNTTNSLTVLNPSGTAIDSTPLTNGTGGLFQPFGVAISPLGYPNGNVWVVDGYTASSGSPGLMSEFNSNASAFGSGFSLGTVDQAPLRDAVDANGYVWVTNSNNSTISQLNPSGTLINTVVAGSLSTPYSIAVDPNNNIWIGNAPQSGTSSLTKYSVSAESVVAANNYTGGGLNQPDSLAIDGAGNVWAANYNSSTLSEFNSSGVAITPTAGYNGSGVFSPTGIGIDPSGNVWTASFSGGRQGVTVFFGAAAPTVTPKVTALANGFVP